MKGFDQMTEGIDNIESVSELFLRSVNLYKNKLLFTNSFIEQNNLDNSRYYKKALTYGDVLQ